MGLRGRGSGARAAPSGSGAWFPCPTGSVGELCSTSHSERRPTRPLALPRPLPPQLLPFLLWSFVCMKWEPRHLMEPILAGFATAKTGVEDSHLCLLLWCIAE